MRATKVDIDVGKIVLTCEPGELDTGEIYRRAQERFDQALADARQQANESHPAALRIRALQQAIADERAGQQQAEQAVTAALAERDHLLSEGKPPSAAIAAQQAAAAKIAAHGEAIEMLRAELAKADQELRDAVGQAVVDAEAAMYQVGQAATPAPLELPAAVAKWVASLLESAHLRYLASDRQWGRQRQREAAALSAKRDRVREVQASL